MLGEVQCSVKFVVTTVCGRTHTPSSRQNWLVYITLHSRLLRTTLHCTSPHCTTRLHYFALPWLQILHYIGCTSPHCTTLHYFAHRRDYKVYTTLHFSALHRLQCTALLPADYKFYTTLHFSALHYTALLRTMLRLCTTPHHTTLHYTALLTLQFPHRYTALLRSTLQILHYYMHYSDYATYYYYITHTTSHHTTPHYATLHYTTLRYATLAD